MKPSALIDIVFPRSCSGCGGSVEDESMYLCWRCISRIQVIRPPVCGVCGVPFGGEVEHPRTCTPCRKRPFFDSARSAAAYTGIVQELIHDFKYHGATWLATDLAGLMLVCLRATMPGFRADAAVFVPLHPSKRRERTYNQSELLAGKVAADLGLPIRRNELFRAGRTVSQTHLTAAGRRVNVRNMFAVRKGVRFDGCGILLIDDVMTTGATLNDCARALKLAGACRVAALTAARG